MKSSISASISSSRMALAAWSTSIILVRGQPARRRVASISLVLVFWRYGRRVVALYQCLLLSLSERQPSTRSSRGSKTAPRSANRPNAPDAQVLKVRRLAAGGKWIRTSSTPAQSRKCGLRLYAESILLAQSHTDPSTPPVGSDSVTSDAAEFDPVLRAPLSQSRLLGLVRKIVPPFEGAPLH